MLKLNASYSKKVPAGEEYSSQSFHASVEVELPDGLTQDQLQSRIHGMRPASPMVRRKRDFFEWEFTKKMNAVGL